MVVLTMKNPEESLSGHLTMGKGSAIKIKVQLNSKRSIGQNKQVYKTETEVKSTQMTGLFKYVG